MNMTIYKSKQNVFIAVVLCCLLVMSVTFTTVPTALAFEPINLSVTSANAILSGTDQDVTINIGIDKPTTDTIKNLKVILMYDTSKLTVKKITPHQQWGGALTNPNYKVTNTPENPNVGKTAVSIAYTNAFGVKAEDFISGADSIGSVIFTVSASAAPGQIPLEVDTISSFFGNAKANQVTPTVSNGAITVVKPVISINVTGEGGASTIEADGGTLQMNANVEPADATDKSVTWSVENGTGSANIDANGLLTAVRNGTVTVKATANDGSAVVGSAQITISNQIIKVTAITVTGQNGASTITTDGGTLQMNANVEPVDATNKTVTWSVENGTGGANIDVNGLLTATGNGTVTVKATANDGSAVAGSAVIIISNQLLPPSAGLTTPFFVLSAGDDTVTPAPAQNTLNYTASVPFTVDSITVTPTAASGTIKVKDNVVASGTASAAIPLNVGVNNITITVQDPGCSIKTYTISVTRAAASTNNNLSALAIKDGATPVVLNPAFAPATTSYNADVADNVALVTVQPTTADPTATVTVNGTNAAAPVAVSLNAVDNPITIEVTAQSGAKKTYTVVVRRAVQATKDQNIDVSGATAPVAITVQEGTTGVTIDVNPVTQPDNTEQATIPQNIDVQVRDNTLGNIEFQIPAGTIVNGPAGWDGKINLPKVVTVPVSSVTGASSVAYAIEVGAGDTALEFENAAVRILMPGAKGKRVGVISGGVFNEITTVMAADTQAAGNALASHGKIEVGNDVAIWTKHFTKFVVYTPATTLPTSGGGGGGGGATPFNGTSVTAADGGTVSNSTLGASVVIPANAMASNFKVRIEKASTTGLVVPDNSKIVGDVVEILKDESANFSKAVTVKLSFDKSKVNLDENTLSLYWYNTSTKKWVELDNVKVDAEAGKVSGEVKNFAKFAILATTKEAPVKPEPKPETPKVTLTDISGHWAQADIQKLVAAGAISGYPNKTFKPNNNITRAEFAVTLVKALKLAPKSGKVFNDTANHWAKDNIATAQAYGIISGYSDTKFGPNDKITREQMAVMVTKAASLKAAANAKTFTDSAKVSAWAKDAVIAASSNGIISGYPDGSFKPKANATRAEAATMIVKIMK